MSAHWVETARGTVHEWQRDHNEHINIRAYMEFFEEACWQFYAQVGFPASVLRKGRTKVAAVQQNIAYRKELFPGDTVVVRTGVLELREKVLRFRHQLLNTESAEVCAECDFTVVCMDADSRRACAFPAHVAARVAALGVLSEG